MDSYKIMIIMVILTVLIGVIAVNDAFTNNDPPKKESKTEVTVKESKPAKNKKHEFNMISYTLELTYWNGVIDTIHYKYIRDIYKLTIKDGCLRSEHVENNDVNDDGYVDSSDNNIRVIQYGTGVVSVRVLAADRKITNDI